MRPLSDAVLLELWERGAGRAPVERALLLLAAAEPARPAHDLARLTIPQRDHAVLELRRATIGSEVAGTVGCPRCGERLEFSVDAAALPASGADAASVATAGGLRFRLPDSVDLQAAATAGDAETSAAILVRRCCLDAADAERLAAPGLLDEVEAGMAALAGAADIQLRFACAACGHAWDSVLDICAFFWEELEQSAEALLDQVHRLASAYGWDEQRILAMSSVRSSAYLERCDP